ncbi:MAG TPA: acyl carrier protein [Chloroflexota bacterium]|nr:acyl carrier protein [Chloroflexota bacterium]
MATAVPFTLPDLRDMLVECADMPASLALDDPQTELADLTLDSVGLLTLQLALEDRYAIRIPQGAGERLRTAQDVLDLVGDLRRASAS